MHHMITYLLNAYFIYNDHFTIYTATANVSHIIHNRNIYLIISLARSQFTKSFFFFYICCLCLAKFIWPHNAKKMRAMRWKTNIQQPYKKSAQKNLTCILKSNDQKKSARSCLKILFGILFKRFAEHKNIHVFCTWNYLFVAYVLCIGLCIVYVRGKHYK